MTARKAFLLLSFIFATLLALVVLAAWMGREKTTQAQNSPAADGPLRGRSAAPTQDPTQLKGPDLLAYLQQQLHQQYRRDGVVDIRSVAELQQQLPKIPIYHWTYSEALAHNFQKEAQENRKAAWVLTRRNMPNQAAILVSAPQASQAPQGQGKRIHISCRFVEFAETGLPDSPVLTDEVDSLERLWEDCQQRPAAVLKMTLKQIDAHLLGLRPAPQGKSLSLERLRQELERFGPTRRFKVKVSRKLPDGFAPRSKLRVRWTLEGRSQTTQIFTLTRFSDNTQWRSCEGALEDCPKAQGTVAQQW